MTKERFMQIAEEVGIASSDWKHDLWRAHIISGVDLILTSEEENIVVSMALRAALQTARNALFRSYALLLNIPEQDSDEQRETEKRASVRASEKYGK